ncbi:hypothetical protein [Allocoleopsis sp.]
MDLASHSQLVTPEPEPEPEEQPINYFPDDSTPTTSDTSTTDRADHRVN